MGPMSLRWKPSLEPGANKVDLVKNASINAAIVQTVSVTKSKAAASASLAIPDCSVTRLALKALTEPTAKNVALVRTKASVILKLVHVNVLLGSLEIVVRMVVPRDTLASSVIANADAEGHDATERSVSAFAMQVVMEGDATKNVLDGHTVSDVRKNVIATNIIHTNVTKLMVCVHADPVTKVQHAHKNALEEPSDETARGSASARMVWHATISPVYANVIAQLVSMETTAPKNVVLEHGE